MNYLYQFTNNRLISTFFFLFLILLILAPAAALAQISPVCDVCNFNNCRPSFFCRSVCPFECPSPPDQPEAKPGAGDDVIPRRPCAVPNPLSFGETPADPCSDEAAGQLRSGLEGTGQGFYRLDDIIDVLAFFIAVVAAPISITMIIWSGIQFLFAQGNPEKIGRAKRTFYWTIIGVAIVIGVFAILATIRTFFRSVSTVL